MSTESGPSSRSGNTPRPRNNPGSTIERPSQGAPARTLQASVLSTCAPCSLHSPWCRRRPGRARSRPPLARHRAAHSGPRRPRLGGPGRPVAAALGEVRHPLRLRRRLRSQVPGGERRSLRGAGCLRRDLRGQGDRGEQRLGGPRRPPDRHPRAGAPANALRGPARRPQAGVLARYQMTGYSIDGSPVTSTYASLALRGDGSYSFGEPARPLVGRAGPASPRWRVHRLGSRSPLRGCPPADLPRPGPAVHRLGGPGMDGLPGRRPDPGHPLTA